MTAVGAHLGHEVARDAVNNCEDRYDRRYRGSVSYGIGYSSGGYHHSHYSLFSGYAPYDYGFGGPGMYWDYRFHARPWRWHRGY
jgi:hypothetical protein